jgi:hypothetical protein
VKAEVECTALVNVEVDLETGEVASVGIRPTRDEPETPSEVTVSLESELVRADVAVDKRTGLDRSPGGQRRDAFVAKAFARRSPAQPLTGAGVFRRVGYANPSVMLLGRIRGSVRRVGRGGGACQADRDRRGVGAARVPVLSARARDVPMGVVVIDVDA